MDIEYMQNESLISDMKFVLKTVTNIFKSDKGAVELKDIKILVATHKKYQMPSDKMYLPLHVGAEKKDSIGYKTDDSGKNISLKNPYFCELTGLYWAWKNLKAKYIGLAHYRRHFACKKINKKYLFNSVLSIKEADKIFNDVDIIVPKKRK